MLAFKDLKKIISLKVAQQQHSKLSEILHNKSFWIWNIEEHKQEDINTKGQCCFNHIISLPQKDGVDKPLYDYEKIIFDFLVTRNSNKNLWIKKATGLGVSEFMLRFMAWLCLKDNALSGSQMCIVTGPRIDLAIALIDRMKDCFQVMVKVLSILLFQIIHERKEVLVLYNSS
jgi:primosomal protein N'